MDLAEWLNSSSSFVSDAICVRSLESRGRSVICQKPIVRGQRLILIRRKHLLNISTISSPQWSHLTSHQQLAAYIAVNRGTKDDGTHDLSDERFAVNTPSPSSTSSPFSLFLKYMPVLADFANMPITWSANQLSQTSRQMQEHVRKQRDALEADWNAIESSYPPIPIDREQFVEAWLCVNTRCLYMDVNYGVAKQEIGPSGNSNNVSKANNMTMAPFVDFLNHSVDQAHSVKIRISAIGMEVFAAKDYNLNEEVLLSYGPHDNTFLWCEYGFTVNNNPWDYVDVSQEITDMLDEQKKDYLREAGFYGDYTVGVTDGPSFRTLVALVCILSPLESRDLRLFIDGYSDGAKYAEETQQIVSKILTDRARQIPIDIDFSPYLNK